jgi:hypothetical protein
MFSLQIRRDGCSGPRVVALLEPRMRISCCAVLKGQDVRVLDDASADLDGPPDGLIGVPHARAAKHGPQVWQQGLTDLPGGGEFHSSDGLWSTA